MARGGRRAGSRGGGYTNRSDLQLPVAAPEGLPYGDAGKLKAAQRAVPMAPAPTPGPSPSPPGAEPPPMPGGAGSLLRPTERPNEPVTAGMPIGPGPGTEALSPLTQNPGGGSTVAGLLSGLASAPGATDEIQQLASYSQGSK